MKQYAIIIRQVRQLRFRFASATTQINDTNRKNTITTRSAVHYSTRHETVRVTAARRVAISRRWSVNRFAPKFKISRGNS